LEPSYFWENTTLQFLYFIAFIIDNICVSQTVSVQCMYSSTQYAAWFIGSSPASAWDGFFAHCTLFRTERQDPIFFHVVLIFRAILNSFSA
jgi:hypothetical protein